MRGWPTRGAMFLITKRSHEESTYEAEAHVAHRDHPPPERPHGQRSRLCARWEYRHPHRLLVVPADDHRECESLVDSRHPTIRAAITGDDPRRARRGSCAAPSAA